MDIIKVIVQQIISKALAEWLPSTKLSLKRGNVSPAIGWLIRKPKARIGYELRSCMRPG